MLHVYPESSAADALRRSTNKHKTAESHEDNSQSPGILEKLKSKKKRGGKKPLGRLENSQASKTQRSTKSPVGKEPEMVRKKKERFGSGEEVKVR